MRHLRRVLIAACLSAPLCSALALQTQDPAAFVDAERGFEIQPPEGWTCTPQPQPDGTHTTYFLPPGTSGQVLLGVSLRELQAGQGVEHLLELALAKIDSDSAFGEPERFEVEFDGGMRPAMRVLYDSALGRLRVEVAYRAVGPRGYVLQCAAPPDEFESYAGAFEAARTSFRTVEVRDASAEELRLGALAARCGSQVDVAPTWEAAAARARAEERPVLVVAWAYGGFDLPISPRSTVLTDPDLVELLGQRFVVCALDKSASNDFSEHYGLSPTTFGQGLIVAAPDGTILAELDHATNSDLAWAFLTDVLRRHAPAREIPAEVAGAESARARIGRGELDTALALLEGDETLEAELVRARALRLARRGEEALAALERAERLDTQGQHSAQILAERAWILLRLDRKDEARATAQACWQRFGDDPPAPIAATVLGLLEVGEGRPDAVRARWSELCELHPESPWSWQAASWLTSGLLDSGVLEEADLAWSSDEAVSAMIAPADFTALPTSSAGAARDQALAWLLAAQRPDGSWASPRNWKRREDAAPDPFVDAVTALAARSLLPHRGDERVSAALERAYAFLVASVADRARHDERILYMDYTPWSDAALLDTLVAGLLAGVGEGAGFEAGIATLVADLQARRQPHGGWGYYVTGDLEGAAGPPTSMSFTTAAVVLALTRARDAGRLVSEEAVADAAAALESMRAENGHFVYMQGAGARPKMSRAEVPGAAGRAPVCELALLRAGRSSPERLTRALEAFLADAPSLAAQRGKVLMHCGAAGQGCHYILFDYAWAAAAAAELLPDAERRARLLELILDCRQGDGSYLDTPINGRAYGTAQALLALDALAAAR